MARKPAAVADLPVAKPLPEQPNGNGAKKVCPISRQQFRDGAKPVVITINGQSALADPREFSTNSLGWYLNGKTVVQVDGVPVSVQIGLNLTVVGSKELPK